MLDPAAAADAIRSRAVAGAGTGCGSGLVNLKHQLGRDELRGSAAGAHTMSAADLEAASWIDYHYCPTKPDTTKPYRARGAGFEQQISRAAVYANAAAVPSVSSGLETGDVDAGVYDPKPHLAVWPAAVAAGFTTAAKHMAIVKPPAAKQAAAPAAALAVAMSAKAAATSGSGRLAAVGTAGTPIDVVLKAGGLPGPAQTEAITSSSTPGLLGQQQNTKTPAALASASSAALSTAVCGTRSSSLLGGEFHQTVEVAACVAEGASHQNLAALAGPQHQHLDSGIDQQHQQLRRQKLQLLKQHRRSKLSKSTHQQWQEG